MTSCGDFARTSGRDKSPHLLRQGSSSVGIFNRVQRSRRGSSSLTSREFAHQSARDRRRPGGRLARLELQHRSPCHRARNARRKTGGFRTSFDRASPFVDALLARLHELEHRGPRSNNLALAIASGRGQSPTLLVAIEPEWSAIHDSENRPGGGTGAARRSAGARGETHEDKGLSPEEPRKNRPPGTRQLRRLPGWATSLTHSRTA
jgi:hypothetical protein